jgi:hypothetical protein
MSRYIPPSKRKDEKPTFDPTTLSNDQLFPSLGAVVKKVVKAGFKDVVEEQIRKEAEDAIRSTQPVVLRDLSVSEREALGYVTLKVQGNTKEEMVAIVERMQRVIEPPQEDW